MPIEVKTVEPKAALAFWRDKAKITPREFSALSDNAKARAFSVAGLAKQDQINLVYNALQDALEKGLPLSQFKKQIKPLLEQKGWVGKNAWRVENIYRTNMQSAFMAGRYEQMQAVVKTRPYWRYVAVKDKRTRPTHAALNGKVFPHDHDFWSVWYPPNGFACRCTVQTLSRRQVDERGYKIEKDIPRLIEPVDPHTGGTLPARPLVPDVGWSGNVGRNWLGGLSPTELDKPFKDLATKAICKSGRRKFADWDDCAPPLKTFDKRHILPIRPGDILPKGLTPKQYAEAFQGHFGLDLDASKVIRIQTDYGTIPIVIDKRLWIDKETGSNKINKGGRGRYCLLAARAILEPFEIWRVPIRYSGAQHETIRMIRLFGSKNNELAGYAIFNLIDGGRYWHGEWSGATAYSPKVGIRSQRSRVKEIYDYLDAQRVGTLLRRDE